MPGHPCDYNDETSYKDFTLTQPQSRRSRILRRVLEYVNAGAWWREKNGLLVFGDKDKVEACIASQAPSTEISNDAVREAQAIRSRVIASRGRRVAARRVTIGKLPPEWTKSDIEEWLLSLSADKREEVTKYILGSLSACRVDPETGTPISREEDNLDAALAIDMIDQLEKSVSATRDYPILRIHHAGPWVQQYFEEAHRCYIHGFELACAVLCRGLLEAVLSDLVDPTYSLTGAGGTAHQSHLSLMIEAARGKILSDKRAAAAEMIRDCGNAAIHDLKTFREHYAPRLGEVLEETRKILSRLYR
jgi:hypothetical protein